MKELSLNILDITKNSVSAGAKNIKISLVTDIDGKLTLSIIDDGCGMSEEVVKNVADPFYTTRTTRKVGMGIPLLRLAAEQTGGELKIMSDVSESAHGTTIEATFDTKSIDFMPIGDMASTVSFLVGGSPDIDFEFTDVTPAREVSLNTKELREVLGEGISLGEPEIQLWIRDYLAEQYSE